MQVFTKVWVFISGTYSTIYICFIICPTFQLQGNNAKKQMMEDRYNYYDFVKSSCFFITGQNIQTAQWHLLVPAKKRYSTLLLCQRAAKHLAVYYYYCLSLAAEMLQENDAFVSRFGITQISTVAEVKEREYPCSLPGLYVGLARRKRGYSHF